MLNYFKVFVKLDGKDRPFIGEQAFEFFDDEIESDTRAAYDRAMASPLFAGPVSVYRGNRRVVAPAFIPSHVPVIGINPDMRKARSVKPWRAHIEIADVPASVFAGNEPAASAIGGE